MTSTKAIRSARLAESNVLTTGSALLARLTPSASRPIVVTGTVSSSAATRQSRT